MKIKALIVSIILLTGSVSFAAPYYWVGDSGNWSDVTKWSSISGGLPDKIVPPTALDQVFFDANSFTLASSIVTLDVNGECQDLDFTGVNLGVFFSSAGVNELGISGNLILNNNVDYSGFVTTMSLKGNLLNTTHSINTNGSSLLSLDLRINASLVTDEYVLQGSDLTVNTLFIESGIFDLNGQDVSCSVLDANPAGDAQRVIDFGGQTIQVRSGGTALIAVDFRSVAGNLSILNAATSTIRSTSNARFNIQAGGNDISIPNLSIDGTTFVEIITSGSSGDNSKTVVLHDILFNRLLPAVNSQLIVDSNVNPGLRKEYGNITSVSRIGMTLSNPAGANFGDRNSIVNGSITLPDDSRFILIGDFFEVVGSTTLSDNSSIFTVGRTRFIGDVEMGTVPGLNTRFNSAVIFESSVTFNGTANILLRIASTYNGPVNVAPGIDLTMVHGSTTLNTVNSDFTVGVGSTVDFGNGANGTWDFNGTTTLLGTNDIDFSAPVGGLSLQNLNISGDATLSLLPDANFEGDVTVSDNATVTFTNNTNPTVTASGTWTTGDNVTMNIGNAQDGNWTFDATSSLILGEESDLTVDCGTNDNTFENLSLQSGSILTFKAGQTTSINGNFNTAGVSCALSNNIRSTLSGSQALLSFANNESETALVLEDVNVISANLTVLDGVGVANVSGVVFNEGTTTLFWVGGTSAASTNNKGGQFSTGDNSNWSNPDNWSGISGNYTGLNNCLPNVDRDIIIDAQSIDPTGDLVIVLDQSFDVSNFSMNLNDDAIDFESAAGLELGIHGNLTLDGETNYSNFNSSIRVVGETGTAVNTIDADGAQLNGADLYISRSTPTERVNLINSDLTVNTLFMESGIFDLNGQDVSCSVLDANPAGDAQRVIDFSGQTIQVRRGGNTLIAVDFRSVAGNLSILNAATSTIRSTSNARFNIQAGGNDISIPNLSIDGTTSVEIITSGGSADNSKTAVFHDISLNRFSPVNSQLIVDSNVNPGLRKEYGNITSVSRIGMTLSNPAGANFGDRNSVVNGSITLPDDSRFILIGDFFEVAGSTTLSDNSSIFTVGRTRFIGDVEMGTVPGLNTRFNSAVIFESSVTFNGTANILLRNASTYNGPVNVAPGIDLTMVHGSTTLNTVNSDFTVGVGSTVNFGNGANGTWDFNGTTTLLGTNDIDFSAPVGGLSLQDLNISGDATLSLLPDANFEGDVTVSDNATVTFTNNTNPTVTASGTWTTGDNVTMNIGNAQDGNWTFDATSSLILGQGNTVTLDPGTSNITLNNVALSNNTILTLNHGTNTTVTGTFTSAGGYCTTPNTLNSTSPGTQADLILSNPTITNVVTVRDINDVNANLTVVDGENIFNNTGITFNDSPQTIFWVGGTNAADMANKGGTASTGDNNNWSNPDNWSIADGVYSGTNSCLPRSTDNVFFNANSFTPAVTDVLLDINGEAGNLSFVSVTNNPTFTASMTRELTLGGSLTLVPAMTWNNAGDILFTGDVGAGTYEITSAGSVLSRDLTINTPDITTLRLADPLEITGELGLVDGEFSMNNQNGTVESLNANIGTTNARTLDFTSSTLNITGGGTWTTGAQQIVLDLRSNNNTNLTVNSTNASTVNFVGNVPDVQLQLGSQPKTLPNLIFSGTTDDIIIFTGQEANCTGRLITFRDITALNDNILFSIDNNADFSPSANNNQRGNRKVFGAITLQDNSEIRFYSPHNNSCGDQVNSFNDTEQTSIGSFSFGNGTAGLFRARFLNVAGASSFGDDTRIIFHEQTEFDDDVTLAGTVSTPFLEFRRELRFNAGTLRITGDATLTSFRNTRINNLIISSGADVNLIPEQNNRDWTFNGNILLENSAQLKIGNFRNTDLFFNGNVTVSEGAFFETNNNSGVTDFDGDLAFDRGSIWVYSQNTIVSLTAGFTATGSCQEFISFRSTANGNAVEFRLTNDALLEGVIVNDLRNMVANLTVNNGQDGGGNDLAGNGGGLGPASANPVVFTNGGGNTDYYWIGGKAIGSGNNLWSDPLNWSTVDGALPGTANVCTPGETDNVFFTDLSFDNLIGQLAVEVDVNNISLNEWNWVTVDDMVVFDPTETVSTRTITVFDDFTWNNRVDNQYEGTFVFDNTRNNFNNRNFIDPAGVSFFGGVRFDKQVNTNWELVSDLDINGGERGDLEIERGRLDPAGNTISLEDDFTIINSNGGFLATAIGGPNPVVPYTIVFDGPDSNPTTQVLSNGRNDMDRVQIFDVVVDRESTGTNANNTVVIQFADGTTGAANYNRFDGDIEIRTGNLEIDNDVTLTGNGGTTDMSISAGSFLTLIGMDQGPDNTFPEGWGTYSFDPNSTVRYARESHDDGSPDGDQNVSITPVYGNIEFTGRGNKTVVGGGNLRINGDVLIGENVTLVDDGNQIVVDQDGTNNDSFTMESNSRFVIGSNAGNTSFPSGFSTMSLDNTLGGEAVVQYNGNGAQTVDDLSATGNDYPVLQISNSGTKTILGNVGILRALNMDGGSILSNAAGNTIEFKDGNGNSDWNISGTSTFIPGGLIYFNGTNHTLNDATGMLAVRNLTLECPNGLNLLSNLEVQNTLTFVDGLIRTNTSHIFVSNPVVGAIVGFDDTHFVNGKLRRAIVSNTSIYPMPVGDGDNTTDYHFLEFLNDNLTGVSFLDVCVTEVPEFGLNADARFASKMLMAHEINLVEITGEAEWQITPNTAPTGGTYGVRLYVKNITQLDATYDNAFTVVKRPDASNDYFDFGFGTSDSDDDTPPVIGNTVPGRIYDNGNGYAERTNFSGFSKFSIAISEGLAILPIEISFFDAQLNDDVVDLEWHTLTEEGSDVILVERSDDLENWYEVDVQPAQGNSRSLVKYFATDILPVKGVAYYRLVEIDVDGNRIVYSDIVSVNNVSQQNEENVSLYPNPVEDNFINLNLSGYNEYEEVSILVIDLNGVEVYADTKTVNDSGNLALVIRLNAELAAGSYTFKIVSNNKVHMSKIIKE